MANQKIPIQDSESSVVVLPLERPPATLSTWAKVRGLHHRPLFLPVSIVCVVLIGGLVTLLYVNHLDHLNAVDDAKKSTSRLTTLAFPSSILAFQNLEGGPPATNSTTTLIHDDGTFLRQFSSSYAANSFYEYAGTMADFSSGLLLSNQLSDGAVTSVTEWSSIQKNGKVTGIASILTPTLNNIWDGGDVLDGDMYFVGTDALYGLFANSASTNFQDINLSSGAIQTALHIVSLGMSGTAPDIQAEGMNAAQTEISFLMDDVSVNGQKIVSPSVVTYNLVTGKIIPRALPASIAALFPRQAGAAPPQISVSADGSLVAYQLSGRGAVDNTNTIVFTTHIFNMVNGQNVIVSGGPSVSLGGCVVPFSFSNDDKYLVICGDTSLTNNVIMEAANTASGAIVQSFTPGAATNYSIAPMGWDSVDSLVYVTNTTTQAGMFNAAIETTHNINLKDGSTHDFPTGLGELLMVLH